MSALEEARAYTALMEQRAKGAEQIIDEIREIMVAVDGRHGDPGKSWLMAETLGKIRRLVGSSTP